MAARQTKSVAFLDLVVFVVLATGILASQKALAQNFISVNYPNAYESGALGINNKAAVVGYYKDAGGMHGFLLQNGVFTTIANGGNSISAQGINDNGDIVGWDIDPPCDCEYGFLISNGIFSKIFEPYADDITFAFGINNVGQIVGAYSDFMSAKHGFILSAGAYTTINYPGSSGTEVHGINNAGTMVGLYRGSDGSEHGFLFQNGAFSSLDYPGATSTDAYGINDGGVIVGSYTNSGGETLAFEYNPSNTDPFSTISAPAQGINNAGQLVGYYANTNNGFVSAIGPYAYVANTSNDSVSMIDIPTSLLVTNILLDPGAGPSGVAVSPDGKQVYVTNNHENSLSVIDATLTPPAVKATLMNVQSPLGVAFTPPDGDAPNEAYVVNGLANKVSVFDTTSIPPTLLRKVNVGTRPVGVAMALTTQGTFAYVTNSGSNNVSVIKVGSSPTVTNVNVGSGPSAVAVSPNSSLAYVANSSSGSVSVISVPYTLMNPITVGANPSGVAFTPDSNFAYVANSGSNTVSVIDTALGSVIAPSVTDSSGPVQVAVSTDGASAYVTNANATVSVIDTASDTIVGAAVTVGSSPTGVAAGPVAPMDPPLVIPEPLSPTEPTEFDFPTNSYIVQYPPGSQFSDVTMVVEAAQITQADFQKRIAGVPGLGNATCIVYAGNGGNCVDHLVTCSGFSGSDCPPAPGGSLIDVETDFSTAQSILNPSYITATINQNNWTEIITGFSQVGPLVKVKGTTSGFSEFVAVDLGTDKPQDLARFVILKPQLPKTFPLGSNIGVEIQLTSVADGSPITDANANISLVMIADANGNPLNPQKVIPLKTTTFKQSQPGVYKYGIKPAKYDMGLGTYGMTISGEVFPVYSGQFLLGSPTTTTLSSSPNPSTYGQPVTFTAVVAPAPPDGETVSFMKGKTVLGTGTTSGGTASFITSALRVGTATVKAVYGGDSKLAGSTSKPVKQVVKRALN